MCLEEQDLGILFMGCKTPSFFPWWSKGHLENFAVTWPFQSSEQRQAEKNSYFYCLFASLVRTSEKSEKFEVTR